MNKDLLLKIVLALSVAVLFFCGIYVFLSTVWKRKLDVKERLNNMVTTEKKKKKGEEGRKKALSMLRVSDALRENLELAKINMAPEEFVFVWLLVTFLPSLVALVLVQRIGVMILLAVVCSFAPFFFVKRKISKQRTLFERQLGDALMVLANAVRAGLSFQQALSNVATDLADPISSEFRSVSRDLQLGGDLEISMNEVADRMKSADLRLITTAVVIQRQVGGNLSEILDTISQTIRDRLAIKRSIQALTAQGRISGKIIGCLPLALLGIIYLTNPTYIEPMFTDPRGMIILAIGVVMEAAGFMWIRKIVNIKF